MINKFAKMRNSWFTKIILTVTALSFMSLFGVSGYINSAASNKAVIKVDDVEISQSEFSYLLQRELAKLRAINGDFGDDENGAQKAMVTNLLAKAKLNDAILENTMKKYNVDFSRNLIGQIIHAMPQFLNNGVFDSQLYQWFLRDSNKSENELIQDIRRSVARRVLVETPLAGTNVPEILLQQMAKVLGQRRTFKYVRINNSDAKINRQPTDDELNLFYDDMSEELMIPEKRDITVLYMSEDDLAAGIEISEEEVETYYKEHKDDYEQPEKRQVLQMVFDDEQEAKNAADKLAAGEDFSAVAAQYGQKAEDIDLGFVAENDVAEELAKVIFATGKNQISAPVQIADSWQIIKVSAVQAPYKVARADANRQIIDELRQEKAYDGSYELVAAIEDAFGAGKTFDEVVAENNIKTYSVKALNEDGSAEAADKVMLPVIANKEIIDTAFSYNEGEISQAVETDEGVAFIRVDKIYDEHKQPREEATNKLMAMWLESERQSVTQKLLEDIQSSIEAGDDLSAIAVQYGLRAVNTRPVTRGESIDKLSLTNMRELFSATKNEPVVIELGDDYVVAETTNIYDDSVSLSAQDKTQLRQVLSNNVAEQLAEALLQDYASKYKVEVQYGRMGLGE
ncbi:MAG: SurA N-terminal domain-containing protein [Alphaproteobacteria bacterium]|nr:SurA N-terminal domain-containing protein [Alphaproteobacteria bacterium]